MVRAILEGRKTQTRRIVKPNTWDPSSDLYSGEMKLYDAPYPIGLKAYFRSVDTGVWHGFKCPYGRPGDQLWVREKFKTVCDDECNCIEYADGTIIHPQVPDHNTGFRFSWDCDNDNVRWRPSIHMPRWASRINLQITGIRVERVQYITEEDAIAEGISRTTKDGILFKYGIPDTDGLPGNDNFGWPWQKWNTSPIGAYKKLWEQINGPGSWDKNPWVWVIEFKVIN